MTSQDLRSRRLLLFARHYHDVPFKFLVLTSRKRVLDPSRHLEHLVEDLRQIFGPLEYGAIRTDEGRGVFHLAVVSPTNKYLDWKVIKKRWKSITRGSDRISISQERNIDAFLEEMTRQKLQVRYSFSRRFVPEGSRKAIEALSFHFTGLSLHRAVEMLALRWRGPEALVRTISCIERGYGTCCDLKTRQVYLVGRTV
jgi:hypothetical protein